MGFINCECKLKVIGVYPKTASNGKTYYHLQGTLPEGGQIEDLGCSKDVFETIQLGSIYKLGFKINPYFLRKEYSTSINIESAEKIK